MKMYKYKDMEFYLLVDDTGTKPLAAYGTVQSAIKLGLILSNICSKWWLSFKIDEQMTPYLWSYKGAAEITALQFAQDYLESVTL